MAKTPSLADDVLALVVNYRPGPPGWFALLPPDAQQELLRARDSFHPAKHQKRAFYRALKSAAEKRGWKIAGEKQVIEWLNRR
jgi:hypothetical protein